jgi:hypothetical protein
VLYLAYVDVVSDCKAPGFSFVCSFLDQLLLADVAGGLLTLVWEVQQPVLGSVRGRRGGLKRQQQSQAQQGSCRAAAQRQVVTVPGSFTAVPLTAVQSKVCIVPDNLRGEGNFMWNDLV